MATLSRVEIAERMTAEEFFHNWLWPDKGFIPVREALAQISGQ